jgi:hypothetical protein
MLINILTIALHNRQLFPLRHKKLINLNEADGKFNAIPISSYHILLIFESEVIFSSIYIEIKFQKKKSLIFITRMS